MSAKRVAVELVVDTNVAVYAFVPEVKLEPQLRVLARACRTFLRQADAKGALLYVPPRFHSEIVSGFSTAVYTGLLTLTDATAALDRALTLINWRVRIPDYKRVLEFTYQTQRKNSGDMDYLEIACALGCQAVTVDRPFVRSAKQNIPNSPMVFITAYPWAK